MVAFLCAWLFFDCLKNAKPIIVTKDELPVQIYAEAVPHLALPLLLLFALAVFMKVFSAERHNCIVNRHREVALSTFQTFHEGTSDHDTRNAILLQAASAVFAPQPTGYTKTPLEQVPLGILKIGKSATEAE